MAFIKVRRLEHQDLPFRVKWYNDSSMQEQVFLEIPVSMAETEEWFRSTLLKISRRDFAFDLYEDSSGSKLIAMGGLVNIDHRHGKAERYLVLDPENTGKGLGFKMLNWLSNFAFLSLNLNRIYGFSIEGNEAILKANQKEGFKVEGLLRQSLYYNGKFVNQYLKSLLREDWEKQPWKNENLVFEISL